MISSKVQKIWAICPKKHVVGLSIKILALWYNHLCPKSEQYDLTAAHVKMTLEIQLTKRSICVKIEYQNFDSIIT